MNALHQYLFDSYRAARLGETPPPAPGTHDRAVLRAVLRWGRRPRPKTGAAPETNEAPGQRSEPRPGRGRGQD
jgi:hypothetical protein